MNTNQQLLKALENLSDKMSAYTPEYHANQLREIIQKYSESLPKEINNFLNLEVGDYVAACSDNIVIGKVIVICKDWCEIETSNGSGDKLIVKFFWRKATNQEIENYLISKSKFKIGDKVEYEDFEGKIQKGNIMISEFYHPDRHFGGILTENYRKKEKYFIQYGVKIYKDEKLKYVPEIALRKIKELEFKAGDYIYIKPGVIRKIESILGDYYITDCPNEEISNTYRFNYRFNGGPLRAATIQEIETYLRQKCNFEIEDIIDDNSYIHGLKIKEIIFKSPENTHWWKTDEKYFLVARIGENDHILINDIKKVKKPEKKKEEPKLEFKVGDYVYNKETTKIFRIKNRDKSFLEFDNYNNRLPKIWYNLATDDQIESYLREKCKVEVGDTIQEFYNVDKDAGIGDKILEIIFFKYDLSDSLLRFLPKELCKKEKYLMIARTNKNCFLPVSYIKKIKRIETKESIIEIN